MSLEKLRQVCGCGNEILDKEGNQTDLAFSDSCCLYCALAVYKDSDENEVTNLKSRIKDYE